MDVGRHPPEGLLERFRPVLELAAALVAFAGVGLRGDDASTLEALVLGFDLGGIVFDVYAMGHEWFFVL